MFYLISAAAIRQILEVLLRELRDSVLDKENGKR
jgi:hypothetical protein